MIKNKTFEGERSLFGLKSERLENVTFENGESPLKETKDLSLANCTFRWKYPLWYSKDIELDNSKLEITARSGIWYTSNIKVTNTLIEAPKTFRRSKEIYLENVDFPNGEETLYNCLDVKLTNCKVNGDYLLLNSENVRVTNLVLNGNYFLDGGKNIEVTNSVLNSKDAFWNCENVVCKGCIIKGEYLGWNSKNVSFIDCEIESDQGLCYMENVKLVNCKIKNSPLIFEYSEIDGDVELTNCSIKNLKKGHVVTKGEYDLIMDEKYIDPSMSIIERK